MKNIIPALTLAVVTTVLALGSPVAANDDDEKDIVDTAVAAGSFTTLAAALACPVPEWC